jgi:hypothetical protein
MRAGRGEEGKHFSLLHPALAHSSFTIRHYGESGPRRSSPRRVCCVGWSKRCVYPGLSPETRARLREMKVAPVAADMPASETPQPEASRDAAMPATSVPKTVLTRAKRAEVE